MEYSIREFLDLFNEGELDVKRYFNDYDTFFTILLKKGLLDELDPIHGQDADDWQNDYLLWLWKTDSYEKLNYWLEKILSDVDFDEKGNVYMVRHDRGDLADLFCDNRRNDISKDTVKAILSGEDIFEPYWDTTDNVYRDVIEELDKENLNYLKKYIVENLKGKQLSPETEEMELIAAEQGHDEYWEIDSNNVARILDNEDSMKSLLDDELSDLKSELYSIHNGAYNSAYEEEIYEDIWKELNNFFDGYGNFETVPHPYKKDTQMERFRIPISDFYGVISDFLSENKGYGGSGTLEYHGSFLQILIDSEDCLSVNAPDYPSPSKIDKNINSFFRDYL